jgi:hypothetical protein
MMMRQLKVTFLVTLIVVLVTATKVKSFTSHQIYDLSHSYHEEMPVKDGGAPLEISPVKQDEGNGVR